MAAARVQVPTLEAANLRPHHLLRNGRLLQVPRQYLVHTTFYLHPLLSYASTALGPVVRIFLRFAFYLLSLTMTLDPASPGSPGLVSPSRRGARVLRNGVALGRRFLEIEGLSPGEIAEVEGILLGSHTSDAFVNTVGEAEDGSGFLTDTKALLVWDMYKMI